MNLVKNVCYLGLIAAIGMLTLTACGKAEKRDAKTAASALINENKNIVAFGHTSVQNLLDKLDYKNLPKINAILGSELTAWEKAIDFKSPIYFAVQAPFAHDGTPDVVYGFINVKNKESLLDKLTSMGYTAEKTGDISYISEDDVTVGVRNNLAILISKKDKYNAKALIEQAFKETEGDESEGKAADILAAKGDIVTGFSIERLYTASNTSLSKLSAAKKTELEGLIADGYVKSVATFSKGEARIKTTNLFSDVLKNRLFFKTDPSASVIKKLGTGNAWLGISGNIDMRKLETFMNDFFPDASKKMNKNMPGEATMGLAMLGDNPLGKLFSGQFGMVAVGDPSTVGMVPQFNFFVGLGSKSDFITKTIEDYATMAMMPKRGDAYIMEKMAIAPRKDGIYGYTVEGPATSLTIPSFAKGFGTNTFSMFLALGQIDVKSLELEPEKRGIVIMESLLINADKDGGELIFVSKDKTTNILKQIGIFYTKMGEERMNEFAFE